MLNSICDSDIYEPDVYIMNLISQDITNNKGLSTIGLNDTNNKIKEMNQSLFTFDNGEKK